MHFGKPQAHSPQHQKPQHISIQIKLPYCATNAESCCLTDWNPSSLEGEIRMANLAPCSTIEGDTESFEWAEMETVPSSPSDDMNWYLEEMPMDELVRFGNDFAENLLWNSFGIFTVARDI
ncbi:hypothetical protein V6N13_004256 [Hibiscus sabdariffa]